MDYRKESLRLHGEWKGKIEVNARAKVNDKDSLSLAYTPGVAEPCLAIKDDYKKRTHLPSITGIPASGPISPRPKTAVPSVITATIFQRLVSSQLFL